MFTSESAREMGWIHSHQGNTLNDFFKSTMLKLTAIFKKCNISREVLQELHVWNIQQAMSTDVKPEMKRPH